MWQKIAIGAEKIRPRRWVILISSVLVIWYGAAVWTGQSAEIDAQRTFWLQDDMMISMRYARNWADGRGPIWNVGERVEGYSNPLWMAWMTIIHWAGVPLRYASVVVQLSNIALACVVLLLTGRLLQRLLPRPGWLLPVVLLVVALDRNLARWAVLGLENTLLTALFLWLVLRTLAEADDGAPRPATFFLAGVLGVVRVDGFIWAGAIGGLALWLNPQRRRVLWLLPLMGVLPVGHVLLRLSYYGYPLPNTYYLKVTGWTLADRLIGGLRYLATFGRSAGVLWLVGGVGIWQRRHREAAALWAMGLPLVAYGVAVGGDDFDGLRLLAAWIPIMVVLGFAGLYWLCEAFLLRETAYGRTTAVLMGTLAVVYLGLNGFRPIKSPGPELAMARVGLTLQQDSAPDSAIALTWAGTTAYFADRPVVDLLGKNDATIAHQDAQAGSRKPGHNKFDYAYSLGSLKPDFVVMPQHPATYAEPAALAAAMQGDDAFVGQLLAHPLFRAHYAPALFFIGDIPLYVRSDSAERETFMRGDCTPVTDPGLAALGLVTVCWPYGK